MERSRQLSRLAEENLAQVNTWRAQAAGSQLHGGDGLCWLCTPRPLWLPGCDRALLPPTAAPAAAEERLEEALAFFQARALPIWCTTTAKRTPTAWHAHLKAAGWQYQFSGTCMALELTDLSLSLPAAPDDMVIAELAQMQGEAYLRAAATHPYFGALAEAKAAEEFAATLRMLSEGQARIFAAWEGEEWLGSAMLCPAAGVAGIYDLGVRQDARRRGIASALVRHLCEAARSAGFRQATLQNGHGLIAFYERLGFRVVSTLQHWQRPADERFLPRGERAERQAASDFLSLETFLHHFFTGEVELAAALLRERPAIARLQQVNGATALHVTSFHGASQLVGELLAAGANKEARERDFGATPLIHAVVGAGPWGPQFQTGQETVIRLLLAAGADIHAPNRWGDRAAQLASTTLAADLRAALAID